VSTEKGVPLRGRVVGVAGGRVALVALVVAPLPHHPAGLADRLGHLRIGLAGRVDRAWTAALVLMIIVLILSAVARLISSLFAPKGAT
jgi:lysylphosphatidylglycerol synthetase-like protein (DUF2156 family)